jgi:hypothetical protein
MGDQAIADSLLDGVESALAAVGSTRQVKIITDGVIDPADPGAGPAKTEETVDVEAILYDYADQYVNNTSILAGDRRALISIKPLTTAQRAGVATGNRLIDGTKEYSIVDHEDIETAGIPVTIILQIRG